MSQTTQHGPPAGSPVAFCSAWNRFFKAVEKALLAHSGLVEDAKFAPLRPVVIAAANAIVTEPYLTWLTKVVGRYATSKHRKDETQWLTIEMDLLADVLEQLVATPSANAAPMSTPATPAETSDPDKALEAGVQGAEAVKGSLEGYVVKVVGGWINSARRVFDKKHRNNEETGKAAMHTLNEVMKCLPIIRHLT